MSLYRQAGRASGRTLVVAAVAALLAGLLGGFLLGRATAPDPTLAEKVAELRSRVRPAEQGIELTATEYAQAVRGGRVVQPTEYQAAQADLGRVDDTLAGARADLRALSAARAAALDRAVSALREAVAGRVAPTEVQRLSDAARAALQAAVGRG
jgi:DNA-binding transcriptional regulator YdaS (Cro superfamily)